MVFHPKSTRTNYFRCGIRQKWVGAPQCSMFILAMEIRFRTTRWTKNTKSRIKENYYSNMRIKPFSISRIVVIDGWMPDRFIPFVIAHIISSAIFRHVKYGWRTNEFNKEIIFLFHFWFNLGLFIGVDITLVMGYHKEYYIAFFHSSHFRLEIIALQWYALHLAPFPCSLSIPQYISFISRTRLFLISLFHYIVYFELHFVFIS